MGRKGDILPEKRAAIRDDLIEGVMSQSEIAKKNLVSPKSVSKIKRKMARGEDVLHSNRGIIYSSEKRDAIQKYLQEGKMTEKDIAREVKISENTVIKMKRKMDSGEDIPCSKRRKFDQKPKVRTAVHHENPDATTSSQTQCPPVTNTPTTSTTRTDITQDEPIDFSQKLHRHRFRGGGPHHSRNQSSVNDDAEGSNAKNDNAGEIDDTSTSSSMINFPNNGTRNVNSSKRLSGSSRNEESSKTLVESTDATASSQDSLAVMAHRSSRFDSNSNKMSSSSRPCPTRDEQTSERPRGNSDSMDEPTPRNVRRAPCARHDDQVLAESTTRSVSSATLEKQKCVQQLRESLKDFVEGTTNYLKDLVEKFETVMEMAIDD